MTSARSFVATVPAIKDGRIQGDVRFEEVREVAGFATPMPGGTGPMTVACLLLNTVRAAAMQGVVAPLPQPEPRHWRTPEAGAPDSGSRG